jgi:hypothetical protein
MHIQVIFLGILIEYPRVPTPKTKALASKVRIYCKSKSNIWLSTSKSAESNGKRQQKQTNMDSTTMIRVEIH